MNINTKRGIKNVTFGLLQQLITIAFGLILPPFLISYGSEVNGLISSITRFTFMLLTGGRCRTASLQALLSCNCKKPMLQMLLCPLQIDIISGPAYCIL